MKVTEKRNRECKEADGGPCVKGAQCSGEPNEEKKKTLGKIFLTIKVIEHSPQIQIFIFYIFKISCCKPLALQTINLRFKC